MKNTDVLLSRYEQIATVTFGDTGVTLQCDCPTIAEAMRVEACRLGANAALLVHEEEPDVWSTCYRVSAKLVWLRN